MLTTGTQESPTCMLEIPEFAFSFSKFLGKIFLRKIVFVQIKLNEIVLQVTHIIVYTCRYVVYLYSWK